MSRPTWARGLKQQQDIYVGGCSSVAPHVGAWIETPMPIDARCQVVSRPTWARGLKRFESIEQDWQRSVAPHVGAWIETS